MNIPLASVIITAYNRERYIREAIESVLHSGYENFELIITDDCSTDATVEIVKEYVNKDERIRLILNKRNLGDYANRNNAAKYATGKYIKYVDSDDKLYTAGLQYCVNCMEQQPEADWAIIYPRPVAKEYVLKPREALRSHFFEQPFLKAGPGQTIIKRSFFEEIGGYPEKYGPANDMYFNLEAASKGNTLVFNDCFLFYRRHEEQEQSDQFRYLYNYNRYLKDALEKLSLPLTEKEIRWVHLKRKRRFAVNIIRYFLATGNTSKTREAIEKADYSFRDFLEGLFHNVSKPVKALQESMEL